MDDGRTDDVVATFCADGSCDIPGLGNRAGHEALRAAYTKWKPRRPQRHLVLNALVTDWNDHEVTAVSDVIFLLKGSPVGQSSSWAATTTRSAARTVHGDSASGRPSSLAARDMNGGIA
jgi:hypothetical protein